MADRSSGDAAAGARIDGGTPAGAPARADAAVPSAGDAPSDSMGTSAGATPIARLGPRASADPNAGTGANAGAGANAGTGANAGAGANASAAASTGEGTSADAGAIDDVRTSAARESIVAARPTTVGIVGAGAVARAFALQLAAAGRPVIVFARRHERALAIARAAGERAAASADAAALAGAPAVLIAVADSALDGVAVDLAVALGRARDEPRAPCFLHTSGARGPEALRALARAGFRTGSLHPLASIAPESDGSALRGAWFAVGGDGEAARAAKGIVASLGGRELAIGASGDDKLRYHAAASLVAGGLAALLDAGERELALAGAAEGHARAALAALAESVVRNVAALGPAAALTGAAARGEAALVSSHLATLEPAARALYAACLPRWAAIGLARGTLSEGAFEAILRVARSAGKGP